MIANKQSLSDDLHEKKNLLPVERWTLFRKPGKKRYRLRVWLACPSRAEDSRRCSSRNVTEGSRTPTVVPEVWARSVAVAFRGRDLQVAALWFNNGIVLNTCLPFPLSKPLYQRQTAPSLSLSVSKHTVFFQRLNCMDQATHRDLGDDQCLVCAGRVIIL